MPLRNQLKIQQRPDSGPERSIWPFSLSSIVRQKWSRWKSGYEEGKQREKTVDIPNYVRK